MDDNRKKALAQALGQIEKQFGKGSVMRMGDGTAARDIEAISTGSIGLDVALGIGGLPKGRVVEIYGPEASGKTTIALQVVAEAQKTGGTAAFVDADYVQNSKWARSMTEALPTNPMGWRHLAVGAAHAGELETARSAVAELLRLIPHDTIAHARATIPVMGTENRERFLDGLRKAGLPE